MRRTMVLKLSKQAVERIDRMKKEDRELNRKICNLCKKPIEDPTSECSWDEKKEEIVWRHKDSYCQKKPMEFYSYMKKLGQTKHD